MVFQCVQWTNTFSTNRDQFLKHSPYSLVYFYPKNDTPWCTKEAQDFTHLLENFQTKNIQIIGISKDSLDKHCSFIEKYALTPIYLSDPDLVLHKQFGAYWEKKSYWRIIQWVIRSTFLLNQSGNILKERKNVKATWHAARVWEYVENTL